MFITPSNGEEIHLLCKAGRDCTIKSYFRRGAEWKNVLVSVVMVFVWRWRGVQGIVEFDLLGNG
jgi:hypothetical protein